MKFGANTMLGRMSNAELWRLIFEQDADNDEMKYLKYRNVKTEVDGILFDSKREANRYVELKLLERAGEITHLVTQPPFNLTVNGLKICKYIADFEYVTVSGQHVIEDAKGVKTAVYRLKKKLMKAVYDIDVVEV